LDAVVPRLTRDISLAIRQILQNILRIGLEYDEIFPFGAGGFSGFARVEMSLSDIAAHDFFLGGYLESLGNGFSSFELGHNILSGSDYHIESSRKSFDFLFKFIRDGN